MTSPETVRFSGERVVVVTGGGRGIGRAVVEKFAASGDSIVAVGRTEQALRATVDGVRSHGHEATYEVCDVTVKSSVDALFERLPPVDVLVNNAGTSSSASIELTTEDDWQAQFAVNATAAFFCTKAVVASMKQRNKGRIVFVASTAGIAGYPYTTAYVASKHAQVGLMRAAAAELAGSGITANAVCPTFVRTEMTERSVQRIVQKTGRTENEAVDALAASSPLKRLLEPQEVAAAVAYLASDEAAAVNGQVLVMDGGGIQR